MNYLFLLLLLVLNFAISYWNAYAAGRYWTEAKLIGGWNRFIIWCAVIMSACGFTWVYLTLLTMLAVGMKWLTPEQGMVMFQLGYLIIIFPVLGSGIGIWADSIITAYRTRRFGDIAVAGWNTFAQAHNTWEAARHAPGAIDSVLEAFSPKGKSSKDSAAGILIILLVILAICGGALTTLAIVRWADRKVAIDVTRELATA